MYKDKGMYQLGKIEEGKKRMQCVICLHSLLAHYSWCFLGVSSGRGFACDMRSCHSGQYSNKFIEYSYMMCVKGSSGREPSSLSGAFLNKIPK